jgi:hypothetical protein
VLAGDDEVVELSAADAVGARDLGDRVLAGQASGLPIGDG